ncbi:MAG: hypothetical protein ACRENA_07370 [Vulcanimicrobiaceae bacterium]
MPLVAAVALFGLPVAGWIVVRAMEHTERMEMIRRGMTPPPYAGRSASTPSSMGPLVLTVFSLALLAAAWLIGFSAIMYSPNAVSSSAFLLFACIAVVPFVIMRALRVRPTRRLRALPPSDDS